MHRLFSRSRSLCFLAIVDVIFLLLILPHSLANYEIFAHNYYFRQIYLSSKVNLLALSNWISASAIWQVIDYSFRQRIPNEFQKKNYCQSLFQYFILNTHSNSTLFQSTDIDVRFHLNQLQQSLPIRYLRSLDDVHIVFEKL